MSRRLRALALATALAGPLLVTVPTPSARGASLLWTLVATPLAATTGVQTTFTLTATNEDPLAALDTSREIGCVVLEVPGNFTVGGVAVAASNAGDQWHIDSVVGNRVTVQTDSGGERLALLDWVRFTVSARALSAGSLTWAARAYRDQGCSGTPALLGVPPVVVVTGPAVTPSPAPTSPPVPTLPPVPTPKPTAAPLPTPPPIATARPLPTQPPSTPAPTAASPVSTDPPLGDPEATPRPPGRPTPSARPSPAVDPRPSDAPPAAGPSGPRRGDSGPGQAPPSAAAERQGGRPAIRFDDRELDLGLTTVGILAGVEIWAVPAATIAGPGLLVLLWVGVQALGALAWVPAARRLRGDRSGRRR